MFEIHWELKAKATGSIVPRHKYIFEVFQTFQTSLFTEWHLRTVGTSHLENCNNFAWLHLLYAIQQVLFTFTLLDFFLYVCFLLFCFVLLCFCFFLFCDFWSRVSCRKADTIEFQNSTLREYIGPTALVYVSGKSIVINSSLVFNNTIWKGTERLLSIFSKCFFHLENNFFRGNKGMKQKVFWS